jgi:hypothetical protein
MNSNQDLNSKVGLKLSFGSKNSVEVQIHLICTNTNTLFWIKLIFKG